ncbi:MAG: MgtC/SapB family protein [Candidatus Promineifilaceae bacterium]|nr:MgtC/SapB family protein [Candidatus Promineifilaceae bacterium]
MELEQHNLFFRFGVALFIGLLVGLQREYSYDQTLQTNEKAFGGVRTFALYGLLGCAGAYLADLFTQPLIFIATLLAVALLIAVSYYVTALAGKQGMTTEVAALVTVAAGALCYWDQIALAVALGVITTALLSFKIELHGFVERLTRDDIVAALKFALITAIILPILPNEAIWPPPFDVLNPYRIWLMVVLISGISFLGYVLFKLLGSRRGISLTGLLGGLVSSTATTLSFSQRSRNNIDLAKPFAMAIIIAWTVMFIRVLIEVFVVNRALFEVVWLPVAIPGIAALAFAAYLFLSPHDDDEEDVVVSNPFELRSAITFGLLFGVILLIAHAAQLYLGDTGVYISSFVSGLADVDAITLSVAELSGSGELSLTVAARAIVIAIMANTLVKGGIVLASGSSSIKRALLPGFLLILIAGISIVVLL